ncbi:TPA: replication initiation protein [Campylobacter lari]|nr:replication initiation protein [Campylobacter lari]
MAKKTEVVELKNGFTRNQSRVSKFITEAKTKMTTKELQAFYTLTTLINMEDKNFKDYSIEINKFCQTLNIDPNNRLQVKKLCKTLLNQDFILDYTYEDTSWDLIKINIFKQFSYNAKEQKINIMFSEDIKPYLLELKERFTKIHQVKYIREFESKYAIRFYTLLKDYRLMSQRDFNIEELNKMFELPKSYDSYTRFYQKVLKPAIDEINAKSDLWVSEPEVIGKKGKKITDFRLYFRNKAKQMSDDFAEVLLKQYNKFKSFNVFKNCYFFQNEYLVKISKIEFDPNTNFFNAYANNGINDYSILGSVNKDDFIKKLINGIYLAINHIYENEKKEQIPALQWQDEKDKAKRFKAIYEEWIGFNPL